MKRHDLSVECRMGMLFTLLLTVLTATSGEDTHIHYSVREGALAEGRVCPSSLQV